MSHVAAEMQRQGLTQPLLIGGATTSRAHTAIKIAPQLRRRRWSTCRTPRAPSASSPSCCRSTSAPATWPRSPPTTKRARPARRPEGRHAGLAGRRARQPFHVERAVSRRPCPNQLGLQALDLDLATLAAVHRLGARSSRPGIWPAAIPAILDDATVGETARQVFADAKAMLAKIVAENWLTANAVFGLYPANAAATTSIIYADEARTTELTRWARPAPAARAPPGTPNLVPRRLHVGERDYVGAFAVTAGLGIESKLAEFEAAHDDYRAIMLKSLADRLAEAAAEWLHLRVRTRLLGLRRRRSARQRRTDRRAIPRHPPGARLPGLPRPHRQGRAVRPARRAGQRRHDPHRILRHDAGRRGFRLLHRPPGRHHYFAIPKIGRDQLEDWAQRKGMSVTDAEHWLAPLL